MTMNAATSDPAVAVTMAAMLGRWFKRARNDTVPTVPPMEPPMETEPFEFR